jgi:hypothetical protein
MESGQGYRAIYDSLSYSQFPDVVTTFFDDVDFFALEDSFQSEFGELLDKKSIGVINRVSGSSNGRRQSQLLGTLATLLWYRREHDIDVTDRSRMRELRFNVGRLSNSDAVFIEYPGKKASETDDNLGPFTLDFAVKLENWSNTNGGQTPRHTEVFSDVYWKVKEARCVTGDTEAVTALREAINEIYAGEFPTDVASQYADGFRFSAGNEIETLLHALFWIAVQEDFNYPSGQGREMSQFILNEIISLSEDEFTARKELFPNSVSIEEYPEYEGIITHEKVKGFDPSDRGELLSVSEITQESYSL